MFDLANPPADFIANPFPHYDRLLRDSPVAPQPDGSVLICKHADLTTIYRDTTTYISDKKQAFAPKFGAGSPLFEHHTTSLVFNDPIEAVRNLLLTGKHASEEDLKAIDKEIKSIVNDSAEFARNSPEPALEELWTDIYATEVPQEA